MQRDFKIGLAVGAVSVTAAMVWLCAQPKLGAETRALRAASAPSSKPAEIPKPPVGIKLPIVEQKPTKIEQKAPKVEQKPAKVEQNLRIHIVQKGDTLSAISQKYYGTARFWQKILAANDAILKDPDRLIPGTRLLIPEL